MNSRNDNIGKILYLLEVKGWALFLDTTPPGQIPPRGFIASLVTQGPVKQLHVGSSYILLPRVERVAQLRSAAPWDYPSFSDLLIPHGFSPEDVVLTAGGEKEFRGVPEGKITWWGFDLLEKEMVRFYPSFPVCTVASLRIFAKMLEGIKDIRGLFLEAPL